MCGHGNLSTDNDIMHKPHTQVGTAKIQYLCKAGKVPGHKLSYGGQTLTIFCLICGKMHWPSWTQVTPSWHTFQIQSITVSTKYSHSRNLLWKRRVAQKVLTSFLHHHSASLAPQSVAPQCVFTYLLMFLSQGQYGTNPMKMLDEKLFKSASWAPGAPSIKLVGPVCWEKLCQGAHLRHAGLVHIWYRSVYEDSISIVQMAMMISTIG